VTPARIAPRARRADNRVPPVIVRIVHAARDLPRLLRDLN
jgi:plasmid stabilization system protein ParE